MEVIMTRLEFYFRKILGKIICYFSGHQMFCDILTDTGSMTVPVFKRYHTTTCQRMCGYVK